MEPGNAIDDLPRTLRAAQAAARELEARAAALTEELARVESILCNLNLGVSAEIPLDADTSLTFGKAGRGLGVRTAETPFQPLVNAPRRLRILSAYRLEELCEALSAATFERLAEVEGALRQVRDFRACIADSAGAGEPR